MSKVTKFLAAIATTAMVVTGLSVMPANAVAPYAVTTVATYANRALELVAGNNRVFYKVDGKLFTSDGTTQTELHDFGDYQSFSLSQTNPQLPPNAGTIAYRGDSLYFNHSVLIGSKLYFWGFNTSWKIWVTDGTVAGTRSIGAPTSPVVGSPTDYVLPNLYAVGEKLFFWSGWKGATGASNAQLYRVDTAAGSPQATAATTASFNATCYDDSWIDATPMQQAFGTINGKLVFDYSQTEGGICVDKLAILDPAGSTPAAANVTRLGQPGTHSNLSIRFSGPQQFTAFNGKLYFYALTGTNVLSELWSTDGTDAGTTSVFAINGTTHFTGVGLRNVIYMRPTVAGSYLYFAGDDATSGQIVLYRTNGTATEIWVPASTATALGSLMSAPAMVLGAGASSKLVTNALVNGANHDAEMAVIDLTAKTATTLNNTAGNWKSGVGCALYCQSSFPDLTGLAEGVTWDSKAWWVSSIGDDGDGGPSYSREIYYSDGTPSGTVKLTDNSTTFGNGPANFTIGWQGSNANAGTTYGQTPNNQWASKPIVIANDRVFYLSASGENGSSWTLNTITRTSVPTPPPTPLTCSNQMSKLKVEADSASDLKQGSTNTTGFSGTVCEYNMTVDSKTSKVDFTPTFTGALTMKVGGTSVPTGNVPKSTKTYSATLGAAGTTTAVDFIFGSNTYRVNVQRLAAVAPGARDPQFTAPTVNGAVVTVDKDTKKEVNQNGDKKETEVTYIGGSFTGKVAKLDDKGEKDTDFESKVPAIGGTVTTVKVDEQHRVLVGGENVDGNKDVVRLKPDGSKDNSFSGPDLGSGKKVDDIEVSKDGKVVIVGDFGDNKNVKKLKDNGSEDETFTNNLPTLGGGNKEVKTAKIEEDGKILIGGSFENAGGDNDKDKIARLEKDGHIDATFVPAVNVAEPSKKAHFNDDVEDIEVQKDGKIVVVGKSEKTSDDEADKVSRLNKDGKEDSTFVFDGNIPSGKKVEAVKVKDSGEIYVAGDFENVGDAEGDKIAKVKKDGHVDTDWNPPTQGGDVHDVELEKHGKVFVGGEGSGDGDRVDKVHEDGDRDGDKPRYDSIDDDRASNKVDTGTKGQTHIHGDGFKDGTTVTIGGKPATVVKIDDRDEDITIQVPTPDNDHKGGSDHERKPADIVITVPNGTSTPDVIEIKEGFGYTDKKEAQQIKPDNDTHINSDKDDDDHKGKVHDDEALAAHIPSDDPITNVSKTPDVCTVDDENRVHYVHRGDCKIVTDAPGDMGHEDPAPVTEVIPVAGLDPELVAPTIPDFADPNVPEVPETGFQIPAPPTADPTIPVVYTPVDPNVCDVTADGLVTPIDTSADCQVKLTTPGDQIYEPTAPTDPPVTVTIPHTAWIPPATITVPGVIGNVISDPDVPSASVPGNGGTVKLGGDLAFAYDKAKGTLTPTAWGIYFGPIKATINYSWTKADNSTGTGTCVVKWGVLKKWSKLSKADQKKYKKPLGAKVFTTTSNCKVSAAAKAALAVTGTSFTATSDVLRIRMWPATYLPKKPNNEPILPRTRHYTLTINTN